MVPQRLPRLVIAPNPKRSTEALSTDPVRTYLSKIGKTPLLTGAQEIDLAMRMAGGHLAT